MMSSVVICFLCIIQLSVNYLLPTGRNSSEDHLVKHRYKKSSRQASFFSMRKNELVKKSNVRKQSDNHFQLQHASHSKLKSTVKNILKKSFHRKTVSRPILSVSKLKDHRMTLGKSLISGDLGVSMQLSKTSGRNFLTPDPNKAKEFNLMSWYQQKATESPTFMCKKPSCMEYTVSSLYPNIMKQHMSRQQRSGQLPKKCINNK